MIIISTVSLNLFTGKAHVLVRKSLKYDLYRPWHFNYDEDFFTEHESLYLTQLNKITQKHDTSIVKINGLRQSNSLIFCDHTVDNAFSTSFPVCSNTNSFSPSFIYLLPHLFRAAGSGSIKWYIFLFIFLI